MSERIKVYVTNIPVRAIVAGWVEVEKAKHEECPDEALCEALNDHGYTRDRDIPAELDDLDRRALDAGWEFLTPEQPDQG